MYQQGSLLELIQRLMPYRGIALAIFIGLPVLTWTVGWILRRFSRRASAWFLTVPVHLMVLPGMAMTMIVGYLMFFTRSNLLANYDLVLFFGPIVSMGLTLIAAWKVLPFKEIPGFERLGGLMLMAAVSFAVAFLLYRMVFGIFFLLTPGMLILLFVVIFAVFKIGAAKVLGKRREH